MLHTRPLVQGFVCIELLPHTNNAILWSLMMYTYQATSQLTK